AARRGRRYEGGKYYLKCLVGRRPCSANDRRQLRAPLRRRSGEPRLGPRPTPATLDRCGLTDSTLVIFVSDHGEGFDERPSPGTHRRRAATSARYTSSILAATSDHPAAVGSPPSAAPRRTVGARSSRPISRASASG